MREGNHNVRMVTEADAAALVDLYDAYLEYIAGVDAVGMRNPAFIPSQFIHYSLNDPTQVFFMVDEAGAATGFLRAYVVGPSGPVVSSGVTRPRTPWDAPRVIAALARRLIVILDRIVVAMDRARRQDGGPAFIQPLVVYIADCYVVAGSRRRGTGAALVRRTEEWARTQGATVISLSVHAGNDAGRTFWEQMGFRINAHACFKSL